MPIPSILLPPTRPPHPPLPIDLDTGDSRLERELAARAAGLRAPAVRPLHEAPAAGPTVLFKQSGIDPLNREPATKPSPTAPFKQSSIDPLNREPAAKSATASFKPFRIDPLNRETPPLPLPIAPDADDSRLERELAAHAAGPRAPAIAPLHRASMPGPTAPFKPSGIDPLNREPAT